MTLSSFRPDTERKRILIFCVCIALLSLQSFTNCVFDFVQGNCFNSKNTTPLSYFKGPSCLLPKHVYTNMSLLVKMDSCGRFEARLKAALIVFVSVLCLVVSAQCYGGEKCDPLGELVKVHRTRRSENYFSQGASSEYSPVYVAPQEGLKEADKIVDLPGQPEVSFSQYSGYVTVDPKAGRALFYWLTESEDSPSKPLVLWLSGGPGCSSIGNGAMTEIGPFRVNADGKTLLYNKNAWNTVANTLFLDSPAGVGFSYSNTTSDYVTGDNRTAADSYTFLVNWFERFPEYKTRDFYITGESYSGHYVPQLAQLILKNNKITNHTVINLKGIAIGNAYIDYEDLMSGVYDYFWTHALMSDEHHNAILKNCNFSSMASVSEKCQESLNEADADRGNVFIYDIYAPLCGSNSTAPSPSQFDPCSDNYVFTYMNTPDVQKAFRANVTGTPGPFQTCNGFILSNWNDQPETVLPVIKELMASGISVWIYSGDTDGVVPVTATRYSMTKLGSPLKTLWYPWYSRGEVGGYAVEYQNVTFLTVRGAGHFVPSYQPERALTFFSSFLKGKLPPSQSRTEYQEINTPKMSSN